MNIDVIKQVAALPGMSVTELKKMWNDLHQTEPPPFNRAFLVKRLAFRLQELAHGGQTEKTEKRMVRVETEEGAPQGQKRVSEGRLMTGTRLVREWKGVEHCCTALDDGFEYQGRKFGSLSAVANFITGTKWNGLVFWGLKKQGDNA